MDVSNSDADFDSYWEEEARNPNRNRIRIGRQYQATVPPILKQGESDGRKLEELETLKWKPDNKLTDQQLEQYLSVAKAVGLFAQAIDRNYTQNSVKSESEKQTDNTSETNTNSEEKTSCEESCEKSEDKETENNTSCGSTSTSAAVNEQIQTALKGLSDFVSSHHPIHHDIGCRVPTLPDQSTNSSEDEAPNSLISLLSAEWNQKESNIFSRALEVCGKNFGAIKTDFLPWKSVKSIIAYYYLGSDRESTHTSHKDDDQRSDNSVNAKRNSVTASDNMSSTSKTMDSNDETKSEANDSQRTQSFQKSLEDINDCDVKKNFEDVKTSSVSGQEVKPLKAKPILPTAIQESNNNISTVGSLKFYLDGQLVLKLNAQQELLGQKCQWVESMDSSKKVRPVHKPSKRLLIERHDSEHPNHSNNHKYANSDELDEVSNDSSDDDSMESNESGLVPSPSASVAKKAKVKLENNCHKSLSSPTSLSNKDQKLFELSNVSNQCNRSIKTESSVVVKRELSPNSNFFEDDHKKKWTPNGQINDRKGGQSSLENKWYHTIVEKSSLQPPRAHSSSSTGQTHRHSRYDSTQSSSSSSSSTSSSSSSSSLCSSSHSVPVPASVSSVATPVDLTRKSTNCSPFETKSSPSSSSTPNFSSYPERDKNLKMSSPSPPRLQPPFVFPYPAYLPLSPTQSQHKIKREVKSSSNSCQKTVDGRSLSRCSPPSSPSSMPSTTPPLPSQFASAWLQNPLVSYSFYEQYYRYYYGMPAPNHSPGERQPSSAPKESETNSKERTKCLSDAVLVDGDDGNCGS